MKNGVSRGTLALLIGVVLMPVLDKVEVNAAPGGSYTVSGDVVDGHGRPFPGARVVLEDVDPQTFVKEQFVRVSIQNEKIVLSTTPMSQHRPLSEEDKLRYRQYVKSTRYKRHPGWRHLLRNRKRSAILHETKTDTMGRYQFVGLADGPFRVTARSPGRVADISLVWPDTDTPKVKLNFFLAPAYDFIGQVEDEKGGPIPGAVIVIKSPRGLWRSVQSDGNGRFKIEGMPSTGEGIGARMPGFLGASKTVRPRDGTESSPFRLVLVRAPSLAGNVSQDGKPVEGAEVLVNHEVMVKTDRFGRFSAVGIDDEGVYVRARKGASLSRRHFVKLSTRKVSTVNLELVSSGKLEARVTDVAGRPIKNMSVFVNCMEQGRTSRFITNSSGVATIELAPTGPLQVEISPKNMLHLQGDVELKPGETKRLEFVLKPGIRHRVRVLLQDGSPAPEGIEIRMNNAFQNQIIRTDTNGVAYFNNLSGHNNCYEISHEGFCNEHGQLNFNKEETQVILKQTGRIEGVVVDAGGHGLAGIMIVARKSKPYQKRPVMLPEFMLWLPLPGERILAETNSKGRFLVDKIGPEPIYIRAVSEKYHYVEPVKAKAGDTDLSFILIDRLSVKVRVVDQRGNPVPFARVHMSLPGTKKAIRKPVQCNAKGRFIIENLQPGCFMLRASDYQVQSKAIRACAGDNPVILILPVSR